MKYTHALMQEKARNENVEMKNSYSKECMYAGKCTVMPLANIIFHLFSSFFFL